MYAIVYFDPERALAASALARSLARRAEGAADAYVVLARSLALIANGRVAAAAPLRAAAERVMARFEQMVDATGDYADAQMIYSWIAMDRAALLVADPDQLRRRGAAIARQRGIWGPLGDVVALFVAGQYGGRMSYDLGRWDDARAEASARPPRSGDWAAASPGLRNTLANLAELAAARGAEAECRASVGAAAEISGWPFPFAGISGAAALGLFALGQGEYERAVAEFERVLLPRMGAFLLSHEVADAIEAYARSGRRADACRWLEPFATQARASGWPWAQARAADLEALLTDDGFDEPFAAALAIHEQAQQPFPRARSEPAYAERLRRAGRRRAAREQAHAALATFEQLGAEPWAERAAAELRATGERVRRRRDGDRSRLTPQDFQSLHRSRAARRTRRPRHASISAQRRSRNTSARCTRNWVCARASNWRGRSTWPRRLSRSRRSDTRGLLPPKPLSQSKQNGGYGAVAGPARKAPRQRRRPARGYLDARGRRRRIGEHRRCAARAPPDSGTIDKTVEARTVA